MAVIERSQEIALEVEIDLGLDPDDIARFWAYVDGGMTQSEAARQTAQDMLGGVGVKR